jgi:hypothetical protein
VKKLADLGLVRVRQQNNMGHGIVQIVEPIADRLVTCGPISDRTFEPE